MGWEGVLFLYFPVPKTKKKTGMVAWTRQPGPVVGLGIGMAGLRALSVRLSVEMIGPGLNTPASSLH